MYIAFFYILWYVFGKLVYRMVRRNRPWRTILLTRFTTRVEHSMSTYIRLYRSVLDHPLLSRDLNAYIVFTKILLRVDWQTGKLITGRFKLAEMTGLKPTTVYQTLRRLENDNMLTQEHDNKKTIITVINWKKYQSDDNGYDNNMTTIRQPDDTINNNKRIKNKKESIQSSPQNTASRFRLISEIDQQEKERIAAEYQVTTKSVDDTYQELVLYCGAKGKKYANYSMALQSWVRRALAQGKIKQVSKNQPAPVYMQETALQDDLDPLKQKERLQAAQLIRQTLAKKLSK